MSDDRFRRHVAEGEVLFKQGDRGDHAYLVEAGALEVSLDHDGQREILSTVGPGALLGEMALLDDSARMATVTATEPSLLRVVTRKHLNDRLDIADPLLRHVLHLVATRYRDVAHRLGGTLAPSAPDLSGADRTGDHAAVIDRLRLEQDLEMALEQGELVLHYQPIMRLADDSVAGFEALIRWVHPVRGLIRPDDFIPLAERSGLIVPIGHWVVRTAVEALALFERMECGGRGREPLFMTVNLSAQQFGDPQLVGLVDDAVRYRGIAPQRLRLEITESSLMDQMGPAAELMQKCRTLGVGLSVDDFGTGYSALSYLYRLPVTSVKLARRFITDLAAYPASRQIVGAVARLATELGMDTVCEGVETPGQAAAIAELGVPFGQGYHYAAGLPLPSAISYLRHSRRPLPRRQTPELRAA